MSRTKKQAMGMTESLEQVAYQHTVLCQTCLPYRNPGDDVKEWKRKQGDVSLSIEALNIMDRRTDQWVNVGLPYGPKARLIISNLNSEALKTGSPEIEVERSLTAFVRRLQDPTKHGKSRPSGPQIGMFKNQLLRLSFAAIHMAMRFDERTLQVNSHFVGTLEFWSKKSGVESNPWNDDFIWPQTLCLSQSYFENLQKHAVPLDERALAILSNSAMALDIHAWLAQRLHRIPREKPQSVSWVALKAQFGPDFGRMVDFRAKFRATILQVLACYSAAKVESSSKGLILRNSPPPVSARLSIA